MLRAPLLRLIAALSPFALTACSAASAARDGGGGGTPSTAGSAALGGGGSGSAVTDPLPISLDVGGQESQGGAISSGTAVEILKTLPEGFTAADADHPETGRGGYKVLGPLADVPPPN